MMDWTAEAIAELRRLWEVEGLTASPIAARMGLTKNQVIGKAHRLGLTARPSPIPGRVTGQPAAPRAPRVVVAKPATGKAAPRVVAPVAVEAVVSLLRPRRSPSPHRACQFIAGQPAGLRTVFCCAPVLPGSSFCPAHHAACWHPYQPKVAAA